MIRAPSLAERTVLCEENLSFPILQHEVCQREGRVLLQASSKQSGEGLAERGAAGISLPWVEQREAW